MACWILDSAMPCKVFAHGLLPKGPLPEWVTVEDPHLQRDFAGSARNPSSNMWGVRGHETHTVSVWRPVEENV